MRRLGLYLCGDLEFGPPKFLYLELMLEAAAGDIAVCREIDPGVAEIGIVGDRKFEVESSERVQIAGALCDLVIPSVFDGELESLCRIAETLDIAEFASRDLSDIALDGDLFFRLIKFAVVKNEPPKRVDIRLFIPRANILPIIFTVFG